MKIEEGYFAQLIAGQVDGPLADLSQLASFWSSRAQWTEEGGLSGLSPEEATVHLMLLYTGEVGNGGHVQYFLNPGGALSIETIRALRDLGESELAAALESANCVFSNGQPPTQRTKRVAEVESLDRDQLTRLDDLDQRVWKLMSGVDERALAFLRAHSDAVLTTERS